MTEEELAPPPEDPSTAVALAVVHDKQVTASFWHSWDMLRSLDTVTEGRIWRGGTFAFYGGTDGLADARNGAVKQFLAESTAHWLLWLDSDMGFHADTLERLFEAADPTERPVVGALCFANREVDNDGMGGRRALAAPVIMHWRHDGDETGFETRWDYPRDTVVRCDGIGSACVLVHRSVFERVAAQFGPNWYTRSRNPATGAWISEDLSFCVRMLALDIPIHVHTGVQTTHAKWQWIAEEDYWRQRALNPPPLTVAQRDAAERRDWSVPRYAIVPTHNRPGRLTALVASLGAQCDRIVVLDNASDPPVETARLQEAAGKALVEVLRDGQQPPNLARFWNIMFDHCEDDAAEMEYPSWDVAVLNDDSMVPAGWYDACSTGLRAHSSAVIAHTNPTSPALLTEFGNDPDNRMCPHAFVVRGEVDLRSDESMFWWYQDSDLDNQARMIGGTLSVDGPRVVNALANTTTVGVLAERAAKDREAFQAKWGVA